MQLSTLFILGPILQMNSTQAIRSGTQGPQDPSTEPTNSRLHVNCCPVPDGGHLGVPLTSLGDLLCQRSDESLRSLGGVCSTCGGPGGCLLASSWPLMSPPKIDPAASQLRTCGPCICPPCLCCHEFAPSVGGPFLVHDLASCPGLLFGNRTPCQQNLRGPRSLLR